MDAISQFAPNCDFDSVIDIGCACGDLLDCFIGIKINRAVGMDFGKWDGNRQGTVSKYRIQTFYHYRIPSRDSSFDLVLAMEVLYYLSKQDLETVNEIKRVAAPGGLVVVSVALGDDTILYRKFSVYLTLVFAFAAL